MKKEGKFTIIITIGISCFVLAMTIFMQFKVVRQADITSIDIMREEDLQEELATWKSKYEETEEKYNDTIKTLNKYKEESTSDGETKKNLEEELEKLELMLGVTDVEGEGIIITLQEKEGEELEKEIDADELMIIVNYLRDAGAEAISINDQRIVNNTYFAYINNSFVKINSQRVSSPYTIKAIGDPDYLKSSLIGNGGYSEKISSWGQDMKIETKRKVNISKYDGEINTKYIE